MYYDSCENFPQTETPKHCAHEDIDQITDVHTATRVCTSCGLVLEERLSVCNDYRNEDEESQQQQQQQVVQKFGKDIVLTLLCDCADRHHLPRMQLVDIAQDCMNSTDFQNIFQYNSHDEKLAVLIYHACAKMQCHRSIHEVSQMCDVTTKRLWMLIHKFYEEIKQPIPLTSAHDLLERMLSTLDYSFSFKDKEELHRNISLVESAFEGHRPYILPLCALLHMAAQGKCRELSVKQLSATYKVSSNALMKASKKFAAVLNKKRSPTEGSQFRKQTMEAA